MYHVEYHHSQPLDSSPAYYWHFWAVVDQYGHPYEFVNYQLATFSNEQKAKEFCDNLNKPKPPIDFDGRSE